MAEHFLQDLRYAARQLRNNPGFALVTILVLALGIGANAAVFAVINTVLLRPLSFPDPDQLVQVWESNPSHGRVQDVVSPYNFLDWQKQSKTLSALAVYEYESLALTTRAAPARMDAAFVSGGFFRVFQVQPQLGRTFLPEEDRPGSHAVVLSYLGWGSRFNYDPHIVGKSIVLDGEPYTVIGVMPAGFRFPARGTDLWAAPAFDLKTRSRGGHFLFSVGRMRPGVTLAQAQAEMNTIARRLEQQYPDSNRGAGVTLVPLQDQMVRRLTGPAHRLRQRRSSVVGSFCCSPKGICHQARDGRQPFTPDPPTAHGKQPARRGWRTRRTRSQSSGDQITNGCRRPHRTAH
jgi:predicted permease